MKKSIIVILMVLIAAVSLSAQGSSEAQAAEAGKLEHVDFLLNWTIAADHAPYYVALKNGWYKDAGIDLNIIIGQGSGYSVTMIDAGKADIAIADAPVVFKYHEDGADAKIVGTIFDKHPNSMYFFKDSGITKPQDIVGKTVAVPATDGHKVMWPAFAAMIGVPADSVEFINIDSTAKVSALVSRHADVVFELLTGYPNFAAATDPSLFSYFLWADYGFQCYAHSYITSSQTIAKRPEMLKKFLDVTYRAWEWTITHPEEAIKILAEYQPININDLVASLKIEQSFIMTERFKKNGIGYIDPAGIQATYDLVNAYQTELHYNVSEIYDARFLPATPYKNI